jgi:DNA polymerase
VTFEQSIWRNYLTPKHGWPEFEIEQWRDTAALGLAVNMPKTLKGLAQALGGDLKDDEGSNLMRSMCIATASADGEWTYPNVNPENLIRLAMYCMADVIATAGCYERLPPLSVAEQLVWFEDQRINERGVFVDRELSRKFGVLVEARKEELANEARRLSLLELSDSTSTPALKSWLEARGCTLATVKRKNGKVTKTLDKHATKKLLEENAVDDDVRAVLENRVEASRAASLAKVNRIAAMVDERDSRFRHGLQYCGASTGRWASYGLQLHNLPRNKLGNVRSEVALWAIEREDLELLALLEDRPLEAISNLLRSLVCAAPGKELICADYSAIEARVVAWLAGQDDIVARFADGEDVYVYTAESIGAPDRFTGKVCTLALGYGMGALKLHATLVGFGAPPTPLREIYRMHRAWREVNPAIVSFWSAIEIACYEIIEQPAGAVAHVGRLRVSRTRESLNIRLPSGRVLRYWRPKLVEAAKRVEVLNEDGEIVTREMHTTELQYYQVGKDHTTMVQTSTYGGKLVENVTQAISRDLLAEALIRLRQHPEYSVVVHVHDSIAAEVDTGAGDVNDYCALLSKTPRWATGCPISAEGYRALRFKG